MNIMEVQTIRPPKSALVVKFLKLKLDENGLLQVEFRHNNQGDTYSERLWGIVSYTLESIPDYDESKCKGFKIIYDSGANSRAEWIVKINSQGTQTEQNPSRYIESCCF